MNKLVTLIAVALISVACSPTPTAAPLANPTLPNIPITNTAPAAPQDVATPTMLIQPTPTNAPETAGLWLQVLAPLDEAVVNTPQVDVTGSAPAGAVVSIDDEILIVGSDQQFKTTVMLDEGPNLIEVIASDESGNELSVLLTVTYEP
jgi:hypothetical protein